MVRGRVTRLSSSVHPGNPHVIPSYKIINAGPLSARFEYDTGFLRRISYAGVEVLRGVYAAVRDHNWDTILPEISDVEIVDRESKCLISFVMVCRGGDVDFRWQGDIQIDAEGFILYGFDGISESDFLRNRIGFCVLHPPECAGNSCRIERVDGTTAECSFPARISPHQPMSGLRSITHDASSGMSVKVTMRGDTFEMEDQRNWTDASFKTYCTPLEKPYPAPVKQGEVIEQALEIRVHCTPEFQTGRASVSGHADVVEILVDRNQRYEALPSIGLQLPARPTPLDRTQIELLKQLRLDHLRVDIDLGEPDWVESWANADQQARDLECGLEVAVFLSAQANMELERLACLSKDAQKSIVRWLIFHKSDPTTTSEHFSHARAVIRSEHVAPVIGAGTNSYFTELNRNRPDPTLYDTVCYSMNPQVHAFDNLSLVETLPMQAETVCSARTFMGDTPICVTPITLKPRFNPNATTATAPDQPDALPHRVDVRQSTLFAAAWTLGSLKSLSTCGAASLTYFETIGWCGVMESASGSPLPVLFPSKADTVFPMFHIFCDWAEIRSNRSRILETVSSDPSAVDVVYFQSDKGAHILLANFGPDAMQIAMRDCPGTWSMRRLDASTEELATLNPVLFRADELEQLTAHDDDCVRLTLQPHATIRLDQYLP